MHRPLDPNDHPWSRPSLRSPEPSTVAAVQAVYAAHRELLRRIYGESSLGVLTALASACDSFEAALDGGDVRLARRALTGLRQAESLARLEARAQKRLTNG